MDSKISLIALENEIKKYELDAEKEITCEHCGSCFQAKNFDVHLNKCPAYLQKIESDILKNKFKEMKP